MSIDNAALLARDDRACTCAHKCVSHGSFTEGEFAGVGAGPCGIDDCGCEAFDNAYPHTLSTVPGHEWQEYCTTCHRISPAGDCERHVDFPRVIVPSDDIRPGDIIRVATGIDRRLGSWTVHGVRPLSNGAQSLRARPLENPRAVDWSLYVPSGEARVISRGVARVDAEPRSMLPV